MATRLGALREWLRDPERRWIVRLVLIPIVLVLVIGFGTILWYTFRVWTEMGPRPWENPTAILDRDGSTVLEIYGDRWRPANPVTLDELPEHVPFAFLAAEDIRFRKHIGIDPWGIGRAALVNLRRGGVAQGGSTITQQVAKARFLSAERTLRRKAVEALVALIIELRLSKDEILSAYLNDVYLGHHAGSSVLGVDEAARIYFDRSPADLSVAQAALLAAKIRAPNQEDQDLLRRRRDAILDRMLEEEWITQDQSDAAHDAALSFQHGSLPRAKHNYYLSGLRAELIDEIGARRLRGGGLRIHTAWDQKMQSAAVDAVVGGVDRLRSRYSWLRNQDEPLQGALLSVDPRTGGVRALVGGTSYVKSQFDRTRSMRRQPGSAVKPFVYAVAIERKELTPASILLDEPVEIELSRNDVWKPRNYDEQFRGEVTVRSALEKSLNVPVIRVAEQVGVRRVRNMLKAAGFGNSFSDTPAIALGVDEVSMWSLVRAYTVFPNLGRRMEPHFVEKVESASGRVIHEFDDDGYEIFDQSTAFVVHSLLRGVVERGTASALRNRGFGAVAGKTGTTSDYRDAWFVGYAPDLVTATWVGFDKGRPLRISSAEAALPLWSRYMGAVPHEKKAIAPPGGVSIVRVERQSGLLWQPRCGQSIEEAFLEGTEPTANCRPRPRPEPEPDRFLEPSVISLEKFREWLEDAPGVDPSDVEPMEEEDAPPGAEPGDIIIEIPLDPDPRDERGEPPITEEPPPISAPVPDPPLPVVPIPPERERSERRPDPEEQRERREERREKREERREEREKGREKRDHPDGVEAESASFDCRVVISRSYGGCGDHQRPMLDLVAESPHVVTDLAKLRWRGRLTGVQ